MDALTSKHGNEGSRVIDGVLKQVKQFLVFGMKDIVILTSITLFIYMKFQLLIELEGAEQRKGVFVIGATDRYLLFIICIS